MSHPEDPHSSPGVSADLPPEEFPGQFPGRGPQPYPGIGGVAANPYPQAPAYPQPGYPTSPGQPVPGYPPAQTGPAFPAYPGYPGGGGTNVLPGTGPRPKSPVTVTAAFVLFLIIAVLSLISMIEILNSPAFQAIINDNASSTDLNGMTPEQYASLTKSVAIGVGALFAVGFAIFALVMWKGRNWARIVLTVLSAFNVVGMLSGAGGGSKAMTVNGHSYEIGASWTTWVVGGLALISIVLMYLAESNKYFVASRIARKGR